MRSVSLQIDSKDLSYINVQDWQAVLLNDQNSKMLFCGTIYYVESSGCLCFFALLLHPIVKLSALPKQLGLHTTNGLNLLSHNTSFPERPFKPQNMGLYIDLNMHVRL